MARTCFWLEPPAARSQGVIKGVWRQNNEPLSYFKGTRFQIAKLATLGLTLRQGEVSTH